MLWRYFSKCLSFRIEMGGKVRKRCAGILFPHAKVKNAEICLNKVKNKQIFM